jgi:hypothetical protein
MSPNFLTLPKSRKNWVLLGWCLLFITPHYFSKGTQGPQLQKPFRSQLPPEQMVVECECCQSLLFSPEGHFPGVCSPLVILHEMAERLWERANEAKGIFHFVMGDLAFMPRKHLLGMTAYLSLFSSSELCLNTFGIDFCMWFDALMEVNFLSQRVK